MTERSTLARALGAAPAVAAVFAGVSLYVGQTQPLANVAAASHQADATQQARISDLEAQIAQDTAAVEQLQQRLDQLQPPGSQHPVSAATPRPSASPSAGRRAAAPRSGASPRRTAARTTHRTTPRVKRTAPKAAPKPTHKPAPKPAPKKSAPKPAPKTNTSTGGS